MAGTLPRYGGVRSCDAQLGECCSGSKLLRARKWAGQNTRVGGLKKPNWNCDGPITIGQT